jgi:tRNA U34 5-methylaminomethyl-2-thiouridine-forming methyltransferase MnmC
MKNFKKLIFTTEDGSTTIFLPDFNEYYHSKYGAVSESEHVFIKNGLRFWKQKNPNKKYCNIFEVGFGTGLNALLTFKESKFVPNLNFTYSSVEPNPLKFSEIEKLNYNDEIFSFIHRSEWNSPIQISKNFTLIKNNSFIQNFNIEINPDIIYFDPFCYRVQPEMWSKKIINPIIKSMSKYSVFVTFSSMNILFDLLKDLKMNVEKIPGPNKKKMIRAFKNS